ncbi:MAG: dTMP kinase [Pseudomonadota bacterium]
MFITFEGIEGCGKTTQMGRLAERLKTCGVPVMMTIEPGGTKIGETIRHILLDSRNRNLSPLAELLLYTADRAQHVEEVIEPALHQGKWVLCDRFLDATVVYQGMARCQDMQFIEVLNDKVTKGICPDITILLDCPVEVGLERALKRNKELLQEGQDRFEREKVDFHTEVRKGYLQLAQQNPQRFIVIDASSSPDKIEENLFQQMVPFLNI